MMDECGAAGEMRIVKGNPMSLSPPQIQHDVIWDRYRTTAVGSRRLAARDNSQPSGSRANPLSYVTSLYF